MARTEIEFQEILGQPAFSELLMRALRIRGDLPRLLVPAFQLGFQFADFEADQWAWLRRATIWGAGVRANPVAAQFSICQLGARTGLASAGRNVVAVVHEVTIENVNAAAIQVELGVVTGGTLIADPNGNIYTRDD